MAISNHTATTTSTQAVAENFGRSVLVITNTGANDVFMNIRGTAEVNKGIFLSASGGVYVMDSSTFSQGAINVITAASTTNLAIYELS